VLDDGSLWCWGANDSGQCGQSTSSEKVLVPTQVAGIDEATDVAAGATFTCVIDGTTASCFGLNWSGQLGDGDGVIDFTESSVPLTVALPQTATAPKAVAAGYFHACALTVTDQIWCWGQGYHGQLGPNFPDHDDDNPETDTPVQAAGLPAGPVQALGASRASSFALIGDRLYSWGVNNRGQLGHAYGGFAVSPDYARFDNADGPALEPVDAMPIMANQHVCAPSSGALYCWGQNANGELGNGTTGSSLYFVPDTPVGFATD
jgi:alpha-tubulin suppressor-like RCC1 family protein